MAVSSVCQKLGGVLGVILAGGLARRMGGGDKTLKLLAGAPLLSHVIQNLGAQVDTCIINANGDPSRFNAFNLAVAPDPIDDHPGPLAGVLAGMLFAKNLGQDFTYIATIPGDSPFLPRDLVPRLAAPILAGAADLTCAASLGRSHPVIGLWPVRLAEDLSHAISVENIRKVDAWTGRYRCSAVPFSEAPHDPFFNINTEDDLRQAEKILAKTRA